MKTVLIIAVALVVCGSEPAAGSTVNRPFEQARTVMSKIDFKYCANAFTHKDDMSLKEKRALNEKLKPLCQEAIMLLRQAYKLQPTSAEINANLAFLLTFDLERILHVGLRSEITRAVTTGFRDESGNFVSGYPDMIKYHAIRCRQNDPTGKYSQMINSIVGAMGNK